MIVLASVRFDELVFEWLDQTSTFLHEHSLEVFAGIILLSFFGGIFLLVRMRRRRRPSGGAEAHVPLTGIFGFLAWPRIHGREAPPPRRETEPWDD
jgi:hypothetical protein